MRHEKGKGISPPDVIHLILGPQTTHTVELRVPPVGQGLQVHLGVLFVRIQLQLTCVAADYLFNEL